MPRVFVINRVAPIRPSLPNRPGIRRVPMHHRTPANVKKPVPQYLPVLQPPIFPREYNFYEEEEEEEQYQEDIFNYPTVIIADQHRTITHQLSNRIPTYMSLPNYTQQLTQHYRYATPKYPSYIYYNR